MKAVLVLFFVSIISSVHAQFSNAEAELFIQVSQPGIYKLSLNGEQITSRTGRFRFYELTDGPHLLSIFMDNRLIYRKELLLRRGLRTIAIYRRGVLQISDELPIYRRGSYQLDNWNRSVEERAYEEQPYSERELSDYDFENLLASYEKEKFDDQRLKFLNLALRNSRISVVQLSELLKYFNFENNKLMALMEAYSSLVDPRNLYHLREHFKFPSNREKLDDFIRNQRR